MGIRRRCRGTCQTTRRCAVPRMQPGTQRPVESIEEARDWERLFIGEIKGGRDPRNKPALRVPETDLKHVAGFLDAYFERQVRPAALRSIDTVRSRTRRTSKPRGTRCGCWPPTRSLGELRMAMAGTESSCGRTTFIGMTFVTKEPQDCSPMAWTSASSS